MGSARRESKDSREHCQKESDKKEKQRLEKEADKMFDLAIQKFDESMKMLSPEQRDVVLVEGSGGNQLHKAQILVLWGNILYERSSCVSSF